MPPFDEFAQRGSTPCLSLVPSDAAAFEMPSLPVRDAPLQGVAGALGGWIETGLDGTFVIVHTPERISELDELLGTVENWVTQQTSSQFDSISRAASTSCRETVSSEQRIAITGG